MRNGAVEAPTDDREYQKVIKGGATTRDGWGAQHALNRGQPIRSDVLRTKRLDGSVTRRCHTITY